MSYMTSDDLRSYIDKLIANESIIVYNNLIDWKNEIGDIARKIQKTPEKQALIFTNIKDYPGLQLFTNGYASPVNIALSFGLNPEDKLDCLIKKIQSAYDNPIEPVEIDYSPVTENTIDSEKVDLFALPVPIWSNYDAGRYIGTWHLNISKDIDNGSRNVGIYRMMIIDEKRTTISFSNNSHLAYHFKKALEHKKELEMAVVIGVDERLIIAGAAALPSGYDELSFAGGLCNKPVQLIKCKTINIEVPAYSEYIIEGIIIPEKVQDGPFLDYTGFQNINRNAYVFEATCIMHRNNPIFRGTAVGLPGAEDHVLLSFLAQCNLVDFHGNRSKQKIINYLLKKKYYTLMQNIVKLPHWIKNLK